MVYDAPGLTVKFSERLKIIKENLDKNASKHVVFHKHILCKDKAHLEVELVKVISLKGEGLMIKDPKCKYEGRRSA